MNSTEETGNSNYQTMEAGGADGLMKEQSTAAVAESHTRSMLKGVTWRFVASMTTVIIAWLVIGEPGIAFQIGLFEAIIKIFVYYLHERIWAKIPV